MGQVICIYPYVPLNLCNKEFEIYWLANADENIVFEWLRKNKPKKKSSFLDSDREDIEKSLIERHEPLINLGLALYGHEPKTGLEVFRKGDRIIKKAALVPRLKSFVTDTGNIKL